MRSSRPSRRHLLGLGLAAGLVGLPCAARAARVPGSGRLEFRARRGPMELGVHRVSFAEEAGRLAVTTEIILDASIAFIPLLRYRHECREVWQDGTLLELESRTEDNGKRASVRARRLDADLIEVTDAKGAVVKVAGPLYPTSYWNMGLIEQDRALNTQNGEVFPIRCTAMGRDIVTAGELAIPAERFLLQGTVDLELWYDEARTWVGSRFTVRGAQITYDLLTGNA